MKATQIQGGEMFFQGWSLPLLEGVGDKAPVLATCSRKTAASHSVLPPG